MTLCREGHTAQCNTKSNRKTIALKRFRRTFAADREALAISGPITRYALAILSAATGARCLRLILLNHSLSIALEKRSRSRKRRRMFSGVRRDAEMRGNRTLLPLRHATSLRSFRRYCYDGECYDHLTRRVFSRGLYVAYCPVTVCYSLRKLDVSQSRRAGRPRYTCYYGLRETYRK